MFFLTDSRNNSLLAAYAKFIYLQGVTASAGHFDHIQHYLPQHQICLDFGIGDAGCSVLSLTVSSMLNLLLHVQCSMRQSA